jgi:transcriptional regulator with XRE-family HTH domain
MNRDFEYQIGQRIREIREEKKMTQEQLSAQMQTRGCDITRSALAKIEVGQRHIYPDELKLLRELLKVSYDALFLEDN